MKKNRILYGMLLIFSFMFITNLIAINELKNEIIFIKENYQTKEKMNSPKRLLLKGAYGDNQSYHPKVLNFNKKWNGYKYWMSFTPYPNADSSKENPHVKVSNDMINWKEPINGLNPLDEVSNPDNNTRYNSDSHLVYNDDKDQIECWWRYIDDEKNISTIYRRISKDGKNWSTKEVVYSSNRKDNDWISPTIIYEKHTYKIWYVYENKIYYTESKNLIDFTLPIDLNIEYDESVKSWHLDVIHTQNGYEMIIVAFTDWEKRALMNLYYTYSKENKNYITAQVIMKPTTNTSHWDNSGLYRSSLIYEKGKYYIFYSGQGTDNKKGIGLMEGKNIFDLKTVEY